MKYGIYKMSEPVAVRYDFDGHGYLYMDAGSGSDWASRVKDCEFLYTKPPTDSEPIAWVYPEFMKNIKDAKCWTAYSTYHVERPIPLYTRPPVNELSDEEIEEVVRLHSWIDTYPKEYINDFARAILKKANKK